MHEFFWKTKLYNLMLVTKVIYKQVLQRKQSGFSMVELAIVVAIVAILSAVAIPSYLKWLPNYRLKAALSDLQSDFQTAKLEAIKRGMPVTVLFTPGGYSLMGQIGSYIVFVDINSNASLDAGETVLTQVNMLEKISLITVTAPGFVRFNSRGLPSTGITVEMRNEEYFGQAVMSIAGRVKRERKPVGGVYSLW